MNIKITAIPNLCAVEYEGLRKVYPGGEALIFAVHASEFSGIDVSLIGGVGNDDYGKQILSAIGYRRMDTTCVHTDRKHPTAVKRYALDRQTGVSRTVSYEPGATGEFSLSKADKTELSISDAVFVTKDAPCFADIIKLKKDYGFKLAVDCGPFCGAGVLDGIGDDADFIMMTGTADDLPALMNLSERYHGQYNIILDDGTSVTYAGGIEYRAEKSESDEIVDNVGCNDAYHAAYVCGFLKDNDILSAMKHASELAAITLEHVGGY